MDLRPKVQQDDKVSSLQTWSAIRKFANYLQKIFEIIFIEENGRRLDFPSFQAGSPHTPLLMSTDSEDESEAKTEENASISIDTSFKENEVLVFPGKNKDC